LVALEQRHLFIERVEAGAEVRYRYHPLFREFLLEQLQEGDARRVGLLRRRAARIYAQKGEPEEAVRHLLAIGELGEATPLIDSLAPGMFSGGRHTTLLDWFKWLGDHAENAPRLLLQVAKVLTDRGDHIQALRILEALLPNPASSVILAEVQVQRGLIWYRRGEIGKALETLGALIESGPGGKTEAYALRVIGLCRHRQGRLLQAKEHLLRALAMYEQLGDAFNQSRVLLDLALPLSSLGQMREISRCQLRALEILRPQGNPAALAMALNNAACNYHHMGQFEKADDCYREAWENAQQTGQRRTEAQILIGRADLLRDTGQPAAALDLYQQSLTLLEPIGESWLQNWARIGLAACHRLADDPRQALGWIQNVAAVSDASVEATRLIERGRIQVALGRLDEAVEVLIQGRDAWATQRAYPELATAELWLGEAYRRAGDGAAAAALERAIQADRQYAEHDIRFVLEARRCPALLAVGEQRSVDPPALDRLRRRVREMNRACAKFARPLAERTAVRVVQVFAFGEGQVERDGHAISAAEWERATARLLFIFLADRSRASRSALLGSFWPDVPENKAISRLHSTMYSARKAVGGDWLIYQPDEGSYQVDTAAGVWCDVTEFEENLSRAKELPPGAAQAMLLQPAIDLYTGPYLAGVDKEWAHERRYELEAAYLEALIDLGDCHHAQQDYEQALEWYSRAYETDNYREDIHRSLMLALAKAGRRAEALRQYESCARILRDELGVEPDQKTRTLLGQIRGL
jgi:DNA-binding SARP family transcriptional activator